MRIEKWGFLLSYAIYLVFCIVFSFVAENQEAINSMIFAITTASTAFAISDIVFTKYNIDNEERKSLFGLYHLTDQARIFYINKIKTKYNQKAEKIVSMLMELFKENDNIIIDFFEGNLSSSDKDKFMTKIYEYSNDELIKFVADYLQSDNSDIIQMASENERKDVNIYEQTNCHKEQILYRVASAIAVLGLVLLLIILTTRISVPSYVNNVFTVIAFLAVIINLILKEYYKANSLKELEIQRTQLLKDLEEHINS